ncbi:hypothetical protein [Actinomadura flavalba]|uniref:hypothetical protein n=1 Tax=Actinomadura flavalba TaxID=1120938 RepID=UPI000370E1A1|nr:hypothetical protein [Actinomadura flavalba]
MTSADARPAPLTTALALLAGASALLTLVLLAQYDTAQAFTPSPAEGPADFSLSFAVLVVAAALMGWGGGRRTLGRPALLGAAVLLTLEPLRLGLAAATFANGLPFVLIGVAALPAVCLLALPSVAAFFRSRPC